MKEKLKHWVIYDDGGNRIGTLRDDMADDEKDAVLNWADEHLYATLEEMRREE